MENIIQFDFGPVGIPNNTGIQAGNVYINYCEAEEHMLIRLNKNSHVFKKVIYKPYWDIPTG